MSSALQRFLVTQERACGDYLVGDPGKTLVIRIKNLLTAEQQEKLYDLKER